MINFGLKPYEWQENMDIILQNVNLNTIEFLDDNSIVFSFLNSHNGAEYKKVICNDVWKFSEENNFEKDENFPFFICDVKIAKLTNAETTAAFNYFKYGFSIPNSDTYCLLCMDGGSVSINLICASVKIV